MAIHPASQPDPGVEYREQGAKAERARNGLVATLTGYIDSED